MRFKLLIILFFFTTKSTYGEGTYHFSDFELTMLPDFCTKRQQGDEQEQILGKHGYINLHHACKGLNHLNRALISTKTAERTNNINDGINELSYVITYKHGAGTNTTLMAFVLYNRARLYIMKGDSQNAINDLSQSISLNPKSPYAYAEFIEFYIKNGDKSAAEKLLNQGIEKNPTSKRLLKLKERLRM